MAAHSTCIEPPGLIFQFAERHSFAIRVMAFQRRISIAVPNDFDTLSSIYRAFNARDIEKVLSVMHPEVEWPNGWEGGYVFGREGVRDYWTRQWKVIDPHVEPVSLETDASGSIVVKVHALIRDLEGNIVSDGHVVHVYQFEDGLIRSMEIHPF